MVTTNLVKLAVFRPHYSLRLLDEAKHLTMKKAVSILVCCFALLACSSDRHEDQSLELENFATFFPNGMVSTAGSRYQGKLHGRVFSFYENGEKWLEQQYQFGVLDGEQLEYRDGKLFSVENFQNGQRDGWAKYFNIECGNLFLEGAYKNDKREGYWYEYYGPEIYTIYSYKTDSVVSVVFSNPELANSIDSPPLPPYRDKCCCANR